MVGTIPADLAQYYAHVLRIVQKLAYLYSWPNLFDENKNMDDGTRCILTLFLGVMFGAQAAGQGVSKVADILATNLVKKLPQKALTKGTIYPIVKRVASYLGVQMTKQTFAKGVGKIVPVIGGVVSGGITLATFRPMSAKLRDYLADLPLAKPDRQLVKTPKQTDGAESLEITVITTDVETAQPEGSCEENPRLPNNSQESDT